MIVVNFFGGPGAGKSTTSAHLFSLLKMSEINCELVTEFAKDLAWSESVKMLGFQPYVFGEQAWRIERLNGKVDVVITDSPLLLSSIYCQSNLPQCFHDYVLWSHNRYKTINFYINRTKKYTMTGRNQTEAEALSIDKKVHEHLLKIGVKFDSVLNGDGTASIKAYSEVIKHLSKING